MRYNDRGSLFNMEIKSDGSVDTVDKKEEKISEPKNYKVILFNDDFTTKEFVVELLIKRFNKNSTEAVFIMETVHRQNQAIVGIYPYDIAATRTALAIQDARTNGFPLRCEMEAE